MNYRMWTWLTKWHLQIRKLEKNLQNLLPETNIILRPINPREVYDKINDLLPVIKKFKEFLSLDQQKAIDLTLNHVMKYLDNEFNGMLTTSFILNGEAGTGKSYLLGYIIALLSITGLNCAILTYTAKAYDVINKEWSRVVSNLNKLFDSMKIDKVIDINLLRYNTSTIHSFFNLDYELKTVGGRKEISNYDLIFIDEYSMISTELMSKISTVLKRYTIMIR